MLFLGWRAWAAVRNARAGPKSGRFGRIVLSWLWALVLGPGRESKPDQPHRYGQGAPRKEGDSQNHRGDPAAARCFGCLRRAGAVWTACVVADAMVAWMAVTRAD